MKIQYIDDPKLSPKNMELLENINDIIEEYRRQGYRLTLRQLFYQLVSRDVIPNEDATIREALWIAHERPYGRYC
jgi:hypothetical protein